MKILIGTVNIASVLGEMKDAFKKLGHHVTLMVNEEPGRLAATIKYDIVSSDQVPKFFRKNLFEGTQSLVLKALRKPYSDLRKRLIARVNKKMLPQLIDEHDLFIFVWSSILPNYSDLKAIKDAGKKIVFIFVDI